MSTLKVNTISERTPANGVVVDGVTIKDSGITISSGGTLQVDGTLKAANGILFGTDTAAVNSLDDYEEGTFTATLRGSTGEPTTLVTDVGYYTKIGRSVTFKIEFSSVNTTGYSGNVDIDGLPFTTLGNCREACAMSPFIGFTFTQHPIAILPNGLTKIELYDSKSNAAWGRVGHAASTGSYVWVAGTYQSI
jgi:hypothetical protein